MCEYCRQFPCVPRCPNYKQKSSEITCSGCGEGIDRDEQYILVGSSYYHKECAYELTAREVFKKMNI